MTDPRTEQREPKRGRTKIFSARFLPQEFDALQRAAEKQGISVSEFMRRAVLEEPMPKQDHIRTFTGWPFHDVREFGDPEQPYYQAPGCLHMSHFTPTEAAMCVAALYVQEQTLNWARIEQSA